ncbi:hypothetical protein [Nocardia sp. alder85J]|uniref:hypothetical protein n=1 Tax=Nocardia sp. alder85J TaxID=2862949 RepID=UPI001CD638DD|nr:hypothetical protein [Nocardia sp. alder85J]MCX4098027.1 hypothetical protein [Nocardia sp. alder85J]
MNQEDLSFESLWGLYDSEKARSGLTWHIKSQLPYFQVLSDDTFDAAYDLAGLMTTDYVRSLPDDDPLLGILALAGELEIKPPGSEKLAREIAAKIATL